MRARDVERPFYLQLSFNAPHTPLEAPVAYVDKYASLNSEPKRLYAAMVDAMDETMGTILDSLADEGLRENTLVLFFSDNGATRTGVGGGSNAPLRGRKGQVYEGGVRLPAALCWPGVLPAGRICTQVTAVIDLFPTLAAAMGLAARNDLPFDGTSRWEQILGTAEEYMPRDLVILAGSDQAAILHEGWKQVQAPALSPTAFELFDITADPTEAQDIATANPDLVGVLSARIAAQTDLLPD